LAVILDTNALSAYADEDPHLFPIVKSLSRMTLPVVVLGEYLSGIALSRNRAKYEAWLESFIADCTVLDITRETTRYYANVVLELRQIGKPIPVNDLWIAALSRQHSLPVVTRDRHFDLVPGLRRLSW
jgi:tRNA(fMet)-specific endonuclease VapC